MRVHNFIKQAYRYSCWLLYNILTLRQAQITYISTKDLIYGFKGDFSPYLTFCFEKSGDWDKQRLLIRDHIVYRSMHDRFVLNKPWEETPHYKLALEKMSAGKSALRSEESVKADFCEWDTLYEAIKKYGLKSNKELYQERKIDNILWLLDEITVNVTREGIFLLNSGWHRVIIAKLLDIPKLPVRILVKHSQSPAHAKAQPLSSASRPEYT